MELLLLSQCKMLPTANTHNLNCSSFSARSTALPLWSISTLLSCYHVNCPFSLAPLPHVGREVKKHDPFEPEIKVYTIRTHNTHSCSDEVQNSSFYQQSLTCQQSLVACYVHFPCVSLGAHAGVEASCSLHCLDCVQPCLSDPLSRHSQDASSQYQAGKHSVALPHTLHLPRDTQLLNVSQ